MKLTLKPRWFQDEAHTQVCKDLGIGQSGKHKMTMVSFPTGGGKTILAVMAIDSFVKHFDKPWTPRVLVIQETEPLIRSNSETLTRFLADEKDVGIWMQSRRETEKPFVFAMMQTIKSQGFRDDEHFDFVVYDEGHHAPAPENKAVIEKLVEKNRDTKFLFLSATFARKDKRRMSEVGVRTCSYNLPISVLIEDGTLVKPDPYVLDLGGVEDLASSRKSFSSFDDDPVLEAIQSSTISKEAILKYWKENGEGRMSMGFANSIKQCEEMAKFFTAGGVQSGFVHSKMPKDLQIQTLKAHEQGQFPFLWNVMQLTEGYDNQPLSCVVNLRNTGHDGTLAQMLGRGLRTVDPARFPGVVKTDCKIFDFGGALYRFPDIFSVPMKIEADKKGAGVAPKKCCKECGFENHLAARVCIDCGEAFPVSVSVGKTVLSEIKMVKLSEIKRASKWRWTKLDDDVSACQTFEGGMVFVWLVAGQWNLFHKPAQGYDVHHLTTGSFDECVAVGDAFLTEESKGAKNTSTKKAAWHNKPATETQMNQLYKLGSPSCERYLKRYEASLWIGFEFAKKTLKRKKR